VEKSTAHLLGGVQQRLHQHHVLRLCQVQAIGALRCAEADLLSQCRFAECGMCNRVHSTHFWGGADGIRTHREDRQVSDGEAADAATHLLDEQQQDLDVVIAGAAVRGAVPRRPQQKKLSAKQATMPLRQSKDGLPALSVGQK